MVYNSMVVFNFFSYINTHFVAQVVLGSIEKGINMFESNLPLNEKQAKQKLPEIAILL